MGLTNRQAVDVVVGCVNDVSGQTPNPGQTLKQGGVVDQPRLDAFKSLVVTDEERGVKSEQHEIESSALAGIGVDDSVQATADLVRANATPMASAELLWVEASAAPARAGTRRTPTRKAKAAKRAATRKGRKTPARKAPSKRKPAAGSKSASAPTRGRKRKTALARKPAAKAGRRRSSTGSRRKGGAR